MSDPDHSLLNAFPTACALICRGRVTACNAMARHYLPQLEEGAPAPAYLPLSAQAGAQSGVFTAGMSTYSFSLMDSPQGQWLLFSPAAQTSLTDTQLDGALRQLRQFMGEFLVQLTPQASSPGFHKSFYRMFRLLDNLEYLRQAGAPDAGQFRPAALDLAGLCHQTVQEAAPLLQEAGVALRWESSLSSLLIPGDGALLRRALLELVANAARACGEGGEIVLRLRGQNGRALLSLSDSGSPLTQRQLAAMLQQDSDQAIPAPGAGAGLGLSVVRHIVALHQGSVMVEWGQGAPVVLLSLPTGPIDPRAGVRTPAVHQDGGLSPLLVALADALPARLFGEDTLD